MQLKTSEDTSLTKGKSPKKERKPKVYPLDARAQELREEDKIPWGFAPIYIAIASVFMGMFTIIVLALIHSLITPNTHSSTEVTMLYSCIGSLVMASGTYYGARKIAQRNGGWSRTFGVTKFKWKYLFYGLIMWAIFMVINRGISYLFNMLHAGASAEGSNVETSTNTLAIVITTLLSTAVITPIVEEFIFRGVILRTFMHKYNFWVSAIATSVIFALLHITQVDTLMGSMVLGITLFILAMLLAWLNRITDSIVPGIIVHMLNNGIVLLFAFYLK